MAQSDTSNVALVQMQCGTDPDENLERAIAFIRDAGKQGADIVCLPELFRSQYFCQSEDHAQFALAEEIPGPTTARLGEVAREAGTVVVASLFEKRAAGVYHNTAAIIDADGKFLGKYRKMHIPDDPGFYEKFYFTPGDLGFKAWPTTRGNIGVCICWDQWYPEAARLTALRGAQLLFYLAGPAGEVRALDDGPAGKVDALPVPPGDKIGRGADVVVDAGIAAGQQVARAETRGRVGARQRLVAPPQEATGQREQIMGDGKVRIEGERLFVLRDPVSARPLQTSA